MTYIYTYIYMWYIRFSALLVAVVPAAVLLLSVFVYMCASFKPRCNMAVGGPDRSKFDKFTMVDPLGKDEEEVRSVYKSKAAELAVRICYAV